MNLYQINEAIETAFALAVDPTTGEVNDEQLYLLDLLELDRDKKIENVALLIKNLKADAAALKAERMPLQSVRSRPRTK